MRKLIAILCTSMLIISFGAAEVAYSQQDIYNSIFAACSWMDRNASPLKNTDSPASDYFIMAMARMNKSYDFDAFAKLCDSRAPSTYRDGQRIVMAKTACGSAVSDDMVRSYTYDTDNFDSLADLAGAIITLDCGRYAVNDEEKSKDTLISGLLAAQHIDGSFSSDCYTTALSIIALSPYKGLNYDTGNDKISVSYSVDSALVNAAQFLGNAKGPDYGYSDIRTTAFVIIALDSIGIDADNDASFSDNGISPVSWLISHQEEDGNFNFSAEDTAFALCALTSHLRAMQDKSLFFSFSEKDPLDLDAVSYDISGNTPEESIEQAVSDEQDASVSEKSVSSVFATPVPKTEKTSTRHVTLAVSVIFTTVIFIGACTYIVIRFKFPELLKRNRKSQKDNKDNVNKH